MDVKSLTVFFFVVLNIFGCTKLPEVKSSSVVSYKINGQFIETYYTKNVFVIESSRKGRNKIFFVSQSELGDFSFVVVADSIVGNYTFENSFSDDDMNRINFHQPNGDFLGSSSTNCNVSAFLVSINSYYDGQQTISGSFEGTVCNKEGNALQITDGIFEYVKLFD